MGESRRITSGIAKRFISRLLEVHFGVPHALLHVFIKIWLEPSLVFKNSCPPRKTESTVTLSRLKDSFSDHEEQSFGLSLDSRPGECSKSPEMGIPMLSQQGLCETVNSLQFQTSGTVN